MKPTFLMASRNPLGAIQAVSYPGQPDELKKYKPGFEDYFEEMYDLDNNLRFVDIHAKHNALIMKSLASHLRRQDFIYQNIPENKFERTIIAIEEPKTAGHNHDLQAGKEIIVAQWGKGFKSPIHGHAAGLLYEELLSGSIVVHTYKIVDKDKRIVRLNETKLYDKPGVILSLYVPHNGKEDRSLYVHSFEALENTSTLHYLPEYNRDGRDNTFSLEEFVFEDSYISSRIRREQIVMGDVLLVRCKKAESYGDHYVYMTGNNGQHIAIKASEDASRHLDSWGKDGEDKYLRFTGHAKKLFLTFHM